MGESGPVTQPPPDPWAAPSVPSAPVPSAPVPYPPAPYVPVPVPQAVDDPLRPYSRRPHVQAQPYHRLLRTARGRWWMPVAGVPVGAVLFLLAGLVVGLAVAATVVLTGGTLDDATLLPYDSPGYYLLTNLSLAVGIPAVAVVVLVIHRERMGWLSSATGRLRWRLLVPFGLAALGVEALTFGALAVVPAPDDEGALGPTTGFPGTATFVAFVAVILFTTPLQAAAEEYVFRGYLGQAIGFFSRSWIPGAIVGGTLFALAHGAQDVGAFLDRFAYGVLFAWLAWRTGGLEAPIVSHTVHNVLTLLLSAAVGALPDPSVTTELPLRYLALDLVSFVAYAVLVDRLARRRGVQTRSAVAPPPEAAPAYGGFPPT